MQPKHILDRVILIICTAMVGGCISPAPQVDVGQEARVARDPAALMRIGDAAAASGDAATASTFYQRAVALQPASVSAALGAAGSLSREGRVDEAITVLQQALTHVPIADRTRISLVLGRLLVLTHRPVDAISVFREAVARDPHDVSVLIGLGVALEGSHDVAGAQDAYRRALAANPDNVAATNDLALSRALQGETGPASDALHALRTTILRTGRDDAALATVDGNLALVSAMQGRMRDAARYGADATPGPGELSDNMRFYSVLRPAGDASGAGDRSGLSPAGAD
ncbi:MAG: tetratricopeptide repeat protein [Janthinobacterium lividum]